jgi:RND family efflux transporter MFP subunit
MNKKSVINIIVLIVIAVIVVLVYTQLSKNKEIIVENTALSQIVNDKIPVNVTEAQLTEFTNSFSTDGNFAPSQRTSVLADMSGKVTQLNIKDGSFISKGGVIAVLDNTLLQNQAKSIEANIAKLKRDLERYNNLAASGGVTKQQIDEVESGIIQYEIQLSSVKKQIADSYLRAPISGVITGKKIEHGSYISPGMNVAEIININPIKFQTYLTENEVFRIKQGQTVEISTNLYSGKDYFGKVTLIDVIATPTKTFLVEITTPNPSSHPLKAGVSGKAHFTALGSFQGIGVPRRAIIGSFDEAKVYVVENGQAALIPVSTGKINDSFVEITSGLSAGQLVITIGQINLKNGTKVEIVKELAKAN